MSDLDELIAELEAQERELEFTRFSNDDAWRLGRRFVEAATERELPIVVDIRRGGQQLFHAALPGTTVDNDVWVQRKVRVVERFGASSFLVGRRLAAAGRDLERADGLDPIDYAAHGGAFPVRVAGVGVVGTVTVSGLPQADDHALVVAILREYLAADIRIGPS